MTAVARPRLRRVGPALWDVTAVALIFLLYALLRDRWTLPHDEDAAPFRLLNDTRDWVDDNRNTSPVFLYAVNYINVGIGQVVDFLQTVVHATGWLGVTVTATVAGWALAGWRISLLTAGCLVGFGVLGLWEASLDTLVLTVAAVLLSLLTGVPLGVLAGRSARLGRLITPVLDVMQIMPTFAYLAPMTLFFLIGAPAATVATMIYAIPPAIRITALGVTQVPRECVEASVSLGSTRWQTLRKVQLPMARSTILLAANQTIMMALSMVVITALIDAPGLGQNIMEGLQRQDVGRAFEAGLAIVLMAIMLDRLTRRAGGAAGHTARAERRSPARRRALFAAGTAAAAIAIAAGPALPDAFPPRLRVNIAAPVNDMIDWVETHLHAATGAIKDVVTYALLNPPQSVLTHAPWWLVTAAVFLIGLRLSGPRPAAVAAACLTAVAALGLWQHGMETLTSVVVAAVLTLAIGAVIGVWSARADAFAAVVRPFLDAAQTMPSFVYLVPAVALFAASRFTAIVAAVIYAVPPVAKLVEDGLRGVAAPAVEAATAAGSTPRQLLWKVQLPMARPALLLAVNQGIVMVLAMVVVGGMVGAGALGYDVVSGFSQRKDFGMGLAAGVAIVLIGVMLDRVTRGAADRTTAASATRRTG